MSQKIIWDAFHAVKNVIIENHEILKILLVSYRNVSSQYTEDFFKKRKKVVKC